MSFGKKVKAAPINMKAKLEKTKREEAVIPAVPVQPPKEASPEAGPSASPKPAESDNEDIGPAALGKRKADGLGDSDSEDDDEDDEEVEVDRTPISHEIILKDHTKVRAFDVSADVRLLLL